MKKKYGAGNISSFKVGSFTYHFLLLEKYPKIIRPVLKILFFVLKGFYLGRTYGRYDYIMSYGTNSTGIGAVILKMLLKTKFIAEIPGVPQNAYKFDTPNSENKRHYGQYFHDILIRLVVARANKVKLLYKSQLDHYPQLSETPRSVFHDFVATDVIEKIPTSDQKYVLLLGFPWYLKGLDTLVAAFLSIKDQFPEHQLKCAGFYPDIENILKLTKNDPQITIMDPVPQNESYNLIASCSVLVLPSRSKAMGRVLLEAMAAKKPLIGSSANGIPTYIKDGINGIIVPPGDINKLANALSTLLKDTELAKQMGENGYTYLKEELDQAAYVRKFKQMLTEVDKTQRGKF